MKTLKTFKMVTTALIFVFLLILAYASSLPKKYESLTEGPVHTNLKDTWNTISQPENWPLAIWFLNKPHAIEKVSDDTWNITESDKIHYHIKMTKLDFQRLARAEVVDNPTFSGSYIEAELIPVGPIVNMRIKEVIEIHSVWARLYVRFFRNSDKNHEAFERFIEHARVDKSQN